jgi:hypothetical protein
MGRLNPFRPLSAEASVNEIMRHAQFYPGDQPFQHHHEVYDPLRTPLNDRFMQRRLFELEKSVKGDEHMVKAERIGFIDYGPKDEATDVLAEVSVPVRAGILALSREVVTITIDDIKADMLEGIPPQDDEKLLAAFVGRAVQIAANGRQENN